MAIIDLEQYQQDIQDIRKSILSAGEALHVEHMREQIAELDNQFHHILYAACGSKMLEHQLIDYHQYVMRVRRKTLSSIERSTESNKEHRAIMEAIRAGKADLAERLASEHMKNAYDNMVRNGLDEIYKETEPAD